MNFDLGHRPKVPRPAGGPAPEATTVTVQGPRRAFAHGDGAWAYEPGAFTLHVGAPVQDEAGAAEVHVRQLAFGGD